MIFEYKCPKCQKVHEVFSNYKAEKEKDCIFCGGKSENIISKSNFKFVVHGEYYNENRQK
jgi:putative FmdB family regulatory protein